MSHLNHSNTDQKQRLAFYKPPQQKSHIYQFEKKDIERSKVVQKRFKQNSLNQVTEGGRADKSEIKLGDTITKINGIDTRNMSLAEANQGIQAAGNTIKLSVKK